LNNPCRKWGTREIRLRYLPKPSLNRWIAEALIDHHRVIEKIRVDIPAGELALLRGEARDSAFRRSRTWRASIARGGRRYGGRCGQNLVALEVEIAEKWVSANPFPIKAVNRELAAKIRRHLATGHGLSVDQYRTLGTSPVNVRWSRPAIRSAGPVRRNRSAAGGGEHPARNRRRYRPKPRQHHSRDLGGGEGCDQGQLRASRKKSQSTLGPVTR